MKRHITAFMVLVFLVSVSPVHGMPVMFTCAYPSEASTAPAGQPFEFTPVSASLNVMGLPAHGEEPLMKASIFELPSFMHARHPGYASSFSSLRPHIQGPAIMVPVIADKGTSPRLLDLVSMLFLGIGMLSLGILGKRIDGNHHLSDNHPATSAHGHL